MNASLPRVSIGVPVYNGEKYLRAALDSLLAQTFTDFEIVICDNASSDSTEQICQEYVQRDRRVKYHRNEYNIGPVKNYNRAFELSQGYYFKWATHDDVYAPTWLERCVEVMDTNPDVALCSTHLQYIDEIGQFIQDYRYKVDSDHRHTPTRLLNLLCVDHRRHSANEVLGLMRRDMMLQIPPQGLYARSDSVFLVRVALFGRFYEVPEPLFFNREHPQRSSRVSSISSRGRTQMAQLLGIGPMPPTEWFDPTKKGKLTMPEWNLVKQYWISIGFAPLQLGDRLGCYLAFFYWLFRHIPKLMRDLLIASELIARALLQEGLIDLSPRKQRSAN
ncbi:MAG: glycosyltransferase family A protein [Synechococcales bacterium]|nr:glycosyltransferase family A protein [Synechococcales bacterium]